MITRNLTILGAACAALVLCGCGDSQPPSSNNGTPSTAATPAAPSAPTTPGAPTPAPAKVETPTVSTSTQKTATATLDIAKTAVSDLASQLAKMAQAQADSMLKGIGNELADKAKALCQSTSGNSNLQAKVDSSMQALMAGNDSSALATLFQTVKEASLTPQQVQLVKEFGNLTSAYVVQRNFSSLDGMQGDVATIVSSLRKGEVTPAIPSIQKVAQNANLTVSQKELIGSLTERYAPGLKGAASTLQQGFQTLQGLKGVGK